MKTIYLDNNATTQVAPEVLETILPYFHELYGNPSSAHSFGGQVAEKVAEAREQVADLLGARPGEIIFTSGGTESDNAAIRSALAAYPEKRHIVTSQVEHPAIRSLCQHLAKEGYRVTEVAVNSQGELDMNQYTKSLTPDTAIVSLMWANNETGVLFPVERAAELAKERDIIFHTDAVQAIGKIPISKYSTIESGCLIARIVRCGSHRIFISHSTAQIQLIQFPPMTLLILQKAMIFNLASTTLSELKHASNGGFP